MTDTIANRPLPCLCDGTITDPANVDCPRHGKPRNFAHIDGEEIIGRCKRENYGFLTESDVEGIAADPRTRLTLLLVRCGGGRFLAPADQLMHFVRIIERDAAAQSYLDRKGVEGPKAGPPSDYIRDISIPAEKGGAR